MNSENSALNNLSNKPGMLNPQPMLSSDNLSPSFNDAPLDDLLDKKVHEMSPEELTEYIKRCSVLRSSAQTRKAALKAEGGVKKKPTKSTIEQALEYLSKIQKT